MADEKKERVQLTPRDRFKKYIDEAHAKLVQLGRIRGSFDAFEVEAARVVMKGLVDREFMRISTAEQIPLFERIEGLAEEMRVAKSVGMEGPVPEGLILEGEEPEAPETP